MLHIDLDSEYVLKSDERQFILSRKSGKAVAYFCNIENLLQYYVEQKLKKGGDAKIETVHELLDYMKNLVTALNKALQPLRIEIKQGGN